MEKLESMVGQLVAGVGELVDGIKALRTDMRDNALTLRLEMRSQQGLTRDVYAALRDLLAELEHQRTQRERDSRAAQLASDPRLAASAP